MNEIYQSGLSGDRVMELLRRQFVVPTLSSAPTTNTLRWVDDMGYTNTFRVGELCRVAIDDGYTFYILKDLKDGVATWELMGSSGGEGDADLTPVYNLIKTKLDNSYFRRIFSPLDANGKEIAPNDTTTPIASVRVNYGLWTEQFLSAKGMNSGGGSEEPTGGATTLGGLRNVAADADRTYDVAKMLVLEADSNLWTLKNLSELVGLDEDALAEYLVSNGYATEDDIESLRGDILTTEGGATIIKKNLVSLKGGDGLIVKDYNTISLLVNTDTFGFGENNELELIKVDGGLY